MPWTEAMPRIDSLPWTDSIVAVIEPDVSLRLALARLLKSADFLPVVFPCVAALATSPLRPHVDCLILDVGAPGLTAEDFEPCREHVAFGAARRSPGDR